MTTGPLSCMQSLYSVSSLSWCLLSLLTPGGDPPCRPVRRRHHFPSRALPSRPPAAFDPQMNVWVPPVLCLYCGSLPENPARTGPGIRSAHLTGEGTDDGKYCRRRELFSSDEDRTSTVRLRHRWAPRLFCFFPMVFVDHVSSTISWWWRSCVGWTSVA